MRYKVGKFFIQSIEILPELNRVMIEKLTDEGYIDSDLISNGINVSLQIGFSSYGDMSEFMKDGKIDQSKVSKYIIENFLKPNTEQ